MFFFYNNISNYSAFVSQESSPLHALALGPIVPPISRDPVVARMEKKTEVGSRDRLLVSKSSLGFFTRFVEKKERGKEGTDEQKNKWKSQ